MLRIKNSIPEFSTAKIGEMLLFVFAFLFISVNGNGQSEFKASPLALRLHAGFANYQGDLQEKRFTTQQAGIAVGVSLIYPVSPKFSLRGGLGFLQVRAADRFNQSPFLQARNLSFSSSILEGNIGVEYQILNKEEYRLHPYLFIGLGVHRFNPYTRDSLGVRYDLRPLRTEGQGLYPGSPNPYGDVAFMFPFGAGLNWEAAPGIKMGVEIGLRRSFTDYLDDVSTRYADPILLENWGGTPAVDLSYRGDELRGGNQDYPTVGSQRGSSRFKDWYYYGALTLEFSLRGNRFNQGGNTSKWGRRGLGCPPRVW
jgi:hypothetical protein